MHSWVVNSNRGCFGHRLRTVDHMKVLVVRATVHLAIIRWEVVGIWAAIVVAEDELASIRRLAEMLGRQDHDWYIETGLVGEVFTSAKALAVLRARRDDTDIIPRLAATVRELGQRCFGAAAMTIHRW